MADSADHREVSSGRNMAFIVIAVISFLLLCLCCFTLLLAWFYGTDVVEALDLARAGIRFGL